MGSEEIGDTEFVQRNGRSILNCCSSIMAADSTSDNVAEMPICSKVDHFCSSGWNAMVLGNETGFFHGISTVTDFAHPHCSSDLVHITSGSGLVGIMPKISSFGSGIFSDMDESGCDSEILQDQRVLGALPNAKRKRNASSCKNAEVEHRMDRDANSNSKKTVDPEENFVHVRAKRGQATSNHSLAERVRRERIGERMRLLQDLVPGCDKITGKAVVLDEIINYVQSLQHQVEFLSMKLATVNPEFNVDIEQNLSKDLLYLQDSNGVGMISSRSFTGTSQNLWNNELESILQRRFDCDPFTSNLGENGLLEMEMEMEM